MACESEQKPGPNSSATQQPAASQLGQPGQVEETGQTDGMEGGRAGTQGSVYS